MFKNPKWEFASTGGGFEEGINNTLTEHFEGNYNYYLAREVLQNSIDARDDIKKPVMVKFQIDYFSIDDFPRLTEFKNILSLCNETHRDDRKTIDFFTNAIEILSKDKFPLLKISDYNTIGLHGNDKERDKPWYSLVKSRGVSKKVAGEGGSFGIGKGAAFAASDLRTVFYSTTSKIDAKSRFIGISILVNFDDQGDTKQSIGTFGLDRQSTIYDPILMGEYWRKEKGLDIYIMGYKVGGDWKNELVKSVLRNFWYAIINEDLVVEVDGTIINFNSLEELLTKHFLDEPFKDYIEPKGNPLHFYRSVLSSTAKKFDENLKSIGKTSLYFLPLEESLNHVAMMRRSHMVIYSKPFHFTLPYAGVLICDDHHGNEELKKMEPPTHDKWDPGRNKKNGKKIMDEIETWIRSCLKKMKLEKQSEISEIPELEKYLPLSEDAEYGGPANEYENDAKTEKEETSILVSDNQQLAVKTRIDPFKVSVINKEETGLGGSGVVVRSGTRKRKKSNKRAPGKGIGKNRAYSQEEIQTRVYSVSKNFVEQEYVVVITSKIRGKCNLKFKAVGEEGSEKVRIKKVIDPRNLNYKLSNNCVHGFYLEENKEIRFSLILVDKLKCSLNLEAYETPMIVQSTNTNEN